MLNELKDACNITLTENGGLTHRTSLSNCVDLFFRAGAMRSANEDAIKDVVAAAFAEDPVRTLKILFFARDVRGGLGERRFFRTAMRMLAKQEPDAVIRNAALFAEYGRYDDLLVLLGTPCEKAAVDIIQERLNADIAAMEAQKPASLLAKWLPSVNTSSAEARLQGKRIAKLLGMNDAEYRKTLSKLRKYTDIIENRLRVGDYTFDYSKQTSGAMFKYRAAFIRHDEERYRAFLNNVLSGQEKMHASTLYPYDIVRKCLGSWYGDDALTADERLSLEASWKSLPAYGEDGVNALAVVDGSGSMYGGSELRPIDVALSLGIYFAEHNHGEFANHFITFSSHPQLVRVEGKDIAEKVRYCARYNEVANTNLEAVFLLLLDTAVENKMPQEEMPARLYIISDMEFDYCVTGGNSMPMFDTMKQKYAESGYKLPEIVFWNVASRQQNIPVKFSETGAALVSGASPVLFDLVASGDITPERVMDNTIMAERYAAVK